MGALKMVDRKKQEFARPIFQKMQDRKMQDRILKVHLAGATALSAVK